MQARHAAGLLFVLALVGASCSTGSTANGDAKAKDASRPTSGSGQAASPQYIGGWHPVPPPEGTSGDGGLQALYCASNDLCLVQFSDSYNTVNTIYRLSSGTDWHAPVPAPGPITQISCIASTTCPVAISTTNDEYSVYRSTDSEGTFDPPAPIPGPGGLGGVSCVDNNFCAAISGAGSSYWDPRAFLRYDGNGFSVDSTVDAALSSLSCTSPTFCIAVAETGQSFRFDGDKWTKIAPIRDSGDRSTVTVKCFRQHECAAIDKQHIYRFDGTAWVRDALPNDLKYGNSLSCAIDGRCVIGGEHGQVVSWTKGSWSKVTNLPNSGTTVFVACTPDGNCIAVDSAGHTVFATTAADW